MPMVASRSTTGSGPNEIAWRWAAPEVGPIGVVVAAEVDELVRAGIEDGGVVAADDARLDARRFEPAPRRRGRIGQLPRLDGGVAGQDEQAVASHVRRAREDAGGAARRRKRSPRVGREVEAPRVGERRVRGIDAAGEDHAVAARIEHGRRKVARRRSARERDARPCGGRVDVERPGVAELRTRRVAAAEDDQAPARLSKTMTCPMRTGGWTPGTAIACHAAAESARSSFHGPAWYDPGPRLNTRSNAPPNAHAWSASESTTTVPCSSVFGERNGERPWMSQPLESRRPNVHTSSGTIGTEPWK